LRDERPRIERAKNQSSDHARLPIVYAVASSSSRSRFHSYPAREAVPRVLEGFKTRSI
jgi:hypothetical protein